MKVDGVKIGVRVARMVDGMVLSGIVKEINTTDDKHTVVFTTDDGEDIQSSVGKLLGLIVGGK